MSRRTKNILSYRWEDERMKVCQEKEFKKCITKKECFYKIYPITEVLKLSEGFTKTLLHTSDKIGIPPFETDGLPA